MKIDELIEQLERVAAEADLLGDEELILLKAAETIRLLWEVARENSLAKYKRQIDEMRGDDAIHAEKH